MKYKDLKNKTIYDFCDDEKVTDELMLLRNKEEFLTRIKEDPLFNAFTLLDLAEKIGDDKLIAEVEKQYKKELEEFFDE